MDTYVPFGTPKGEQNLESRKASKRRVLGCPIGCCGALAATPVLLLVFGYYVLMHTSLPLQFLASIGNSFERVTIRGVIGSFSSGFEITELRWQGEDGRVTVLEVLRVVSKDVIGALQGRRLVIDEIALQRAHIILPADDLGQSRRESSDEFAEHGPESVDQPLELLEIRKLDIGEVIFEQANGDVAFVIDKIHMAGFRLEGDTFELAELNVGSSFIDLELEPAEPTEMGGQTVLFTKRVVGRLKPEAHAAIRRPIDFAVEVGARGGELVTRTRAFDGAVEWIDLGQKGLTLTLREFTAAEYLDDQVAVLPEKLSLRLEVAAASRGVRETARVERGEFLLGGRRFEIAPQEFRANSSDDLQFIRVEASSLIGTRVIEASVGPADEAPYYRTWFSTEAGEAHLLDLALVFFGIPIPELSSQQLEQLDAHAQRYPANN